MVLAILSVRPEGTRFFAHAERKKRNTKEDEVPLMWDSDTTQYSMLEEVLSGVNMLIPVQDTTK